MNTEPSGAKASDSTAPSVTGEVSTHGLQADVTGSKRLTVDVNELVHSSGRTGSG